MARRAAAYCRVSTTTHEQLASLGEQESFFRDYAREHGFILHRIYADGGVSGTRLRDRHSFAEMMKSAKKGEFDLLLVKDISRMARNVLDFLQTVRELKRLGIDCRFLTANCSSGEGELFLTILAAVAQEESANLSKRVKFTKDHHARMGRVPNRVYGYDRADGDIFRLTINEREADVVRRIYRYASEGWGSRRIARLLCAEGVLTKSGHLFGESSVRQILKNPLYCGILRTHQTEVVDYLTSERRRIPFGEQYTFYRPDWAIVSRDVWQAVQKVHAKPKRRALIAGEHLLVCGVCGSTFRTRTQKNGIVYTCGKRDREGAKACSNRTRINGDRLAGSLFAWLDAWLTPARWSEVLRLAEKLSAQSTAQVRRTHEERRQRQDALLLTGAITTSEYEKRCALLADEARASGAVVPSADLGSREAVCTRMAGAVVRLRWIRSITVGEDGTLSVALHRTALA